MRAGTDHLGRRPGRTGQQEASRDTGRGSVQRVSVTCPGLPESDERRTHCLFMSHLAPGAGGGGCPERPYNPSGGNSSPNFPHATYVPADVHCLKKKGGREGGREGEGKRGRERNTGEGKGERERDGGERANDLVHFHLMVSPQLITEAAG